MKVKELIAELQKLDPELHVELPDGPAWFVSVLPAFYDGVHCQLIVDPNVKYYNVLGFKYTISGSKVVIRSHSVRDAMIDNPNIPVDLSELQGRSKEYYEGFIAGLRKEYENFLKEEENENL